MLYFPKWKIFLISMVCILSIIFSVPSLIPDSKKDSLINKILPDNKVNLGLDLRGGSQLLLEIDYNFYINEQLVNLKDDLKSQFRQKDIRVIPLIIGNKITFFIGDEEGIGKVNDVLKSFGDLWVKQESGNFEIAFSDKQINKMQQNLIAQSIEIVRRRIDETGTKEPIIQSQGGNRILLQVPGVSDPKEIKNLLGKTAKMTFQFITDASITGGFSTQISNLDVKKMADNSGNIYLVEKKVALSGDLLVDANPTYYEGEPAVSFRFNSIGAKKFAEITKNNIGRVFAIVLDDKVITAPRINSIISEGTGVISGNFTVKEASDVALLLRAGALPAPLLVAEERTVGPSLGSDSVRSGTIASIIGLILVSVFMIIFYRIFGLIANLALVINIALILSLLSLIGATLTLPGIAGIVLTMGMSVDANVLIYERMKEEARNNKSVLASVDHGFSEAFRTIFDSNITTLIIAAFLYIFGTGLVRGFSVTLSIGIMSSMFTAVLLTRMMIVFWIKYAKPRSLPI